MAISVRLDIVPATQGVFPVSSTGRPQRLVRVGMVEGIDVSTVTGSPKWEAMFLARNAVMDACTANPLSNHPEFVIQDIVLDPVSDTSAIARIIYETLVFGVGIPPSTFVLSDGAILGTEQTNMFVDANGKRRKITLEWWPTDPFNADQVVLEDFVTGPALLPMRTIQVDALTYGHPSAGQDYVGHVNHGDWPASIPDSPWGLELNPGGGNGRTKPRGYWLLFEYATRAYKTQGYYTLTARAVTRVNRDWSDGVTLINTRTGRYVQVADSIETGDDIIDFLFSTPYENDLIRSFDATGGYNRPCGFGRLGRYPVANFETIFGF